MCINKHQSSDFQIRLLLASNDVEKLDYTFICIVRLQLNGLHGQLTEQPHHKCRHSAEQRLHPPVPQEHVWKLCSSVVDWLSHRTSSSSHCGQFICLGFFLYNFTLAFYMCSYQKKRKQGLLSRRYFWRIENINSKS